MKIVIKFEYDFGDEEISEDEAIASAIERMYQDDIDDDNIEIIKDEKHTP